MPSTMRMQTGSDAGSVGPANQPRPTSRPRLAPHVRLAFDPARRQHVLLTPETVTKLGFDSVTDYTWAHHLSPQPS